MVNASVVILTKNEDKNIGKCLDYLHNFREIIVVDDFSSDNTVKIAKERGAIVFSNKLISFSKQRNFGMSKSSSEWVFFIDADESIDDKFVAEINKVISENIYDGFYVKRIDTFLGKKMNFGDLKDVWVLRLARKNKGIWVGKVHEVWKVDGNISRLTNNIIHIPHRTISEFINKLSYYSEIRAKELYEKHVKVTYIQIIFYPLFKFIYLYFIKFGFLDGLHGFLHAIFMSFYTFSTKSRLYLLNKGEK